MNVPSCTNEKTDEELKSWHDWVGSRVSISGTKVGTLRYFGKTHFGEGSWCGVELDEPVGKNDGTVKDVRYFTCKANFGIFAPLSKTEKITDDSHKITTPVIHKSKLPQSKAKLKFIPLQSEIPKSLNETICLSTAKSHLPCYQINANESKANIVNEVYKKQHRKSDDFLEKKKESDPYHFNNNNNNNNSNGAFLELGHLKIAERRTSTPVANPFRKSSTDQMSDIFNRTITLDSNEKIYSNQESLDFLTDNCLLNSTFDLSNTRVLDNVVVTKKESTFVLQNANIFPTDYPKKLSESCIDNEEEPKSSELEESLGILSPSQMKDFTLSFDNMGNGIQVSSKIKKNESCDDVNEIPEFEEKILHESSGDSCDVLINIGSEKSLNDIPSAQTFELINHIDTKGKDLDNAKIKGDKAEISAERPEMQTVVNLTPKELNKLRDSFSFSDFHHIDDVNLNVVPAATSTPTFSSLKLSRPAPIKSTRCNLISSYIHSSSMEHVVSSTTFNRTFSHCFAEQNSPPPEVNVISKLLTDLDQTNEASDIKFKTFKLDNSECESTSRCLFSDLNQECSSFNIEGIADNITMSISNVENKQPILSQTTVLPNSVFSDKELCGSISKSGNGKILEGKSTEPAADSPSLLNMILNNEKAIYLDSQIPTSLNTSRGTNELDELIDTNMKETNCADNSVYQNNTSHIHQTVSYNSNAPDAVTINSVINKTHYFESEITSNTSEKNKKLADAPTLLEENPVHSENMNNNTATCNINLCQVNETKYCSIDESVSSADKNGCLDVSPIEKCDSELEDENTNKLSETFSCSTLKELDNFEMQDDNIYNEESDNTETRVLDVTVTVMKMDNLNVAINIDTNQTLGQVPLQITNQPNSVIHSKNDSAQPNPSVSVKNSPSKGQHTSNVKKSNDVKSMPSKQPKRNVISKIKHMLESGKSSSANQENQKSKPTVTNEKKVGKWDSVTSKIAAGLTENKKPKKEVASRVNTNLNASRQAITKMPSKPNVNRKAETGSKNMASNNLKNSLNSQMACEKSKFSPSAQKVSTEKDLRVLAQLQNVDCDNKQSKDSKVNLKKKRMGLFSKTAGVLTRSNSLSSACSQISFGSSKIILQDKTSMPIQAKGINLKKGESVAPKVDTGPRKAVPPGKSNKITRINCFPRTNTKFISKTSLVQEVKFLTNLCETRKKELNTLEIDLQYATTAFEAVAMLYKHLNEQFDPFSQPFLSEAYEKSKADLQEATEQLLSCQTRLNNIKEIQSREREELVDKLCQIHLTEMNQLKFKHSGELTQMEFQHKKEISTLKENFQSKAEDLRKKNKEMYDTLQEKHKMEKFELERNHEAQLTEIKQQHQVAEDKLTTEVSCLVSQQESLQRQLQNMEDKLMKDKNSIVQRASAEKTALQKEIESLYAVLEIKNQQQRDLQNEQLIWKKQARELHMIKEKVKLFESKTEEQKSLLEKKVKDERSRGLQIQELKKSLKCEENARRNLLMVNEELYYKLQLHTESESLSDNSAYEKNAAIANRSNSLNSLPILPSERCRTLTDVALRYQTNSTSVSMSLSWHPHRPMQKDRIKSKGHSTSHLVTQTNIIPNITQLKKEYCSSSVNQMLLNHPMSMSWGGENFADYFESSDDKNISSENKEPKPIDCKLAKSAFIDSKEVRSNDGNYSLVNRNSKSEVDLDTDKSLSSAISLQSSYTSDSSNSYFAVQPESGDSSSCSQKSKDSDLKDTCDHFMYDDLDPLGVKNPRNLAGESLIQDMNSIVHISKKIHSDIKEELSQIEDNFSSPEEDKHKLSNQISLATPSIDTLSSQGMADSTNLDVSWGDEDIFEKDV